MKLCRIAAAEIVLGAPLPFDTYAADGTLLLSRGSPVASETLRSQLADSAFREAAAPGVPSEPVFSRMERLAVRLAAIEDDVVLGRGLDAWLVRVRQLAGDLIELADEDPDAAFAVLHLEIRHSYDVVHHLMAALVCARLALAAALSAGERHDLVCGAITHDIAILASRPRIEAAEGLVGPPRSIIETHCSEGCRMLAELGVDSELWLRVVAEHHEYLDGSGYSGLGEAQLATPSRIMAVADAFSAMLRPRPYRERVLARNALADLYADPQGRYDRTLVSLLTQNLGLYPPGSVVRLANREIAVVTRARADDLERPHVAAIVDRRGYPLYRAAPRDTRRLEGEIVEVLMPDVATRVRRILPLCWSARPEPL